MRRFLGLLLIIAILTLTVGQAQQKPCTNAQNLQAEDEAVSLRSWDTLYMSYRLYAHCNNADAEEGYSESVARILVDNWETLGRLSQLSASNKAFRRFVLGHVDTTLNMNDVGKIRINAIHHCPVGLSQICRALRKEADATIKEAASVPNSK